MVDEDDELPVDEDWINATEAKAITGRSVRWLQLQADAGEVVYRTAGRGRQYLRSSVESLVADGADPLATDKPVEWILGQTQKHANRSTELTMTALRFVVETCQHRETADRDEMARLRTYIAELEQKLEAQHDAAEQALSEATARFVAEVDAVSRAERQKLVLEKALHYIPQLIGNQKVTQVIAALSEDELALIQAVTDPAKFAHIKGIHDEYSERERQQQQQDSAGDSVCDARSPAGSSGADCARCEGPLDESRGSVQEE